MPFIAYFQCVGFTNVTEHSRVPVLSTPTKGCHRPSSKTSIFLRNFCVALLLSFSQHGKENCMPYEMTTFLSHLLSHVATLHLSLSLFTVSLWVSRTFYNFSSFSKLLTVLCTRLSFGVLLGFTRSDRVRSFPLHITFLLATLAANELPSLCSSWFFDCRLDVSGHFPYWFVPSIGDSIFFLDTLNSLLLALLLRSTRVLCELELFFHKFFFESFSSRVFLSWLAKLSTGHFI